ncbi:hypothetical protein [Streptomyces sp. NPDC048361]|uniref:hypothetical protein n=1 Tax=Streptomyces sp. NPDC048361 TaxID=3154720 RepID=UPI003414F9C2
MPDSTTLQSQYAAQIQSDLDSNVAEREHISAQIGALQEQLTTLENNHALLASMQQAVGGPAAPAPKKAASASGKKTAAAPTPRVPQARSAQKSAGRAGKKQTGPAAKQSKAPKSNKTGKASSGATTTLRDLVAAHLTQSGEPRSAAEITTGLSEAHPDRTIAGTVVRNTLENLVAKGEAQRTRQNRSVFYTAPDATAGAPSADSADADVKKEATAVTPAATN